VDTLNVTLVLADYAVVSDGKLTIVGGGWSITGPDPAPSAVAAAMSGMLGVDVELSPRRGHLL
jgi:hypothetical protein